MEKKVFEKKKIVNRMVMFLVWYAKTDIVKKKELFQFLFILFNNISFDIILIPIRQMKVKSILARIIR